MNPPNCRFASVIVAVMSACQPRWEVSMNFPDGRGWYPELTDFDKAFQEATKDPGITPDIKISLRQEALGHVQPWIDAKPIFRPGHLKPQGDSRVRAI